MRACFYNLTAGFKIGGLETFTWEIARAWQQQGHPAEVWGGIGETRPATDVPLRTFAYTPRQQLPKLGTRFQKLGERLSFAMKSADALLAENFDLVLVNKPYDFPVLWWLRRQGFKGVTAYNSGGTEFYAGDRYFAQAVDLWLPCSAYNAEQVSSHYRKPVEILYNGVDADLFSPRTVEPALRQQLAIPPEAKLVVSVGRLVGWKGIQVIVDALVQVPGLHFLIIGQGVMQEPLRAQAEQLGIAGRVHFAGAVPHAELPKWLSMADIFVQPSIGEEAFGISVAEAMSCQLPVLASDQGGLREVVQDRQTGYLLPAGDVAAWAASLQQLADNPAVGQELGLRGRQRVIDRFTWKSSAEKLYRLAAQTRAGRQGNEV